MDDIDWMSVKEKDDTIRELRQKLAEANKRIAELEEALTLYYDANEALIECIAELEGVE